MIFLKFLKPWDTNTFSNDQGVLIMAGTRAMRLSIVFASSLCVFALMLITVDPETQYTVDEVIDSSQEFEGERVFIRGQVENDSINHQSMHFTLLGVENQLVIDYSAASVPDAFSDGLSISVRGTLISEGGILVLKATEIQTGCPSKYES